MKFCMGVPSEGCLKVTFSDMSDETNSIEDQVECQACADTGRLYITCFRGMEKL
jgi:hypothetical protein